MITREQAREIAERFVRQHALGAGWDGVAEVLSPEEVEAAMHPGLRALSPNDAHWRRCWTVRIRGSAGGQVLIALTTGEVDFAGAVKG